MRNKLTAVLALSTLLWSSLPSQAAFVIKNSTAVTAECKSSNLTNITTSAIYTATQESSSTPNIDKSKQSKTEKRGYGVGAFVVSLLGVGAALGAFAILPVSLIGFILLAVLAGLFGFAAIGCADIDKKSIAPQPFFATFGMVLGILEALPLLIPFCIIYLIYYLCGGGRHKNGFK